MSNKKTIFELGERGNAISEVRKALAPYAGKCQNYLAHNILPYLKKNKHSLTLKQSANWDNRYKKAFDAKNRYWWVKQTNIKGIDIVVNGTSTYFDFFVIINTEKISTKEKSRDYAFMLRGDCYAKEFDKSIVVIAGTASWHYSDSSDEIYDLILNKIIDRLPKDGEKGEDFYTKVADFSHGIWCVGYEFEKENKALKEEDRLLMDEFKMRCIFDQRSYSRREEFPDTELGHLLFEIEVFEGYIEFNEKEKD